MRKLCELLVLIFLVINITSSDSQPLKDGTVNIIDETVEGTTEYMTKSVTFSETDSIHYFKYNFGSNVPSSLITAFTLDITPYAASMGDYKVLCTNVLDSTSDADLIAQLKDVQADESKSSCFHIFKPWGFYYGIMKLDSTKTTMGMAIYIPASFSTEIRIYLRIAEKILSPGESQVNYLENYSLVPVTIKVQDFRQYASKILFYSSSRVLQMYETVSSDYAPTKLFVGSILNVYTNPNMVRQKYHNATIMTLLCSPNQLRDETFKFEVSLFPSNYLLDYYVSSNPEGRPLNSPLLINMTECSSPYYVILNYNANEYGKTLILDEIYGKISYLGVATQLIQPTWKEMIEKDVLPINLKEKKYSMPLSIYNMDVYRIECSLPVMINFYYVDPKADIYEMNEGDVQVFSLQPYQTLTVPFVAGIVSPEILIEVNQPDDSPNVIIIVTEEKVIQKNTLERYQPMSVDKGIIIKERGGSSDTRVILKVGYSISKWSPLPQDRNIKYNSIDKVYLFEFPNDNLKRYFYTYAKITLSGTNAEDNVKFCFTSSIGGALRPSSENCYRVSKTNSYYLNFYNPYIMYKNYEYSDELKYSVTLKPTTDVINFGIITQVFQIVLT